MSQRPDFLPPSFDAGAAADPDSGLFGLSVPPEAAQVHVLGVPFDATTSYRPGTARGPKAVLRASHQVDLYDRYFGRPYEAGIALLPEAPIFGELQARAFPRARPVIDAGGRIEGNKELAADLAAVNRAGEELNQAVREAVESSLQQGALPVVLGGDHSVPFGAMEALAQRHPGLGILHFDAHADLRDAYEGFTWSHASILRNAMDRIDGIGRLVQVGLRDISEEEVEFQRASEGRIVALWDDEWAEAGLEGRRGALIRRTIAHLPKDVYISFDVDGLDPVLCPNTGTPVPGGLSWHDAMAFLVELTKSGRRVVGLDLVEVSPGEPGEGPDGLGEHDSWDANVGARLLYRLIGCALATRK